MSTVFALLYVVAFIVMIVFLIRTIIQKKNGQNNSVSKLIAIISLAGFIIFFILTGIANSRSSDMTPVANNESKEVVVENQTEVVESEKSEPNEPEVIVEEPEPSISQQDINYTGQEKVDEIEEVTEEDDLGIITRTGHPTYYGSVEQSHSIWDDVEKGKIHFADKNYGHNDNPIISMECYRNEDIIRGILVVFCNCDPNPQLDVETVLPIVASYMPYEIMDKWYQYSKSKIVAPDIEGDKNTVYVISYRLSDEGKEAYSAKTHTYSGSIDVLIEVTNGCVVSFDITYGEPKWMMNLNKNGYHEEEWSCDLYDYR